jgi:2-polyprenyl-6-methoxyphenol hydroxylase-like FAD-dependent oxidoreductase
MSTDNKPWLIAVVSGPSGLLLALMLARKSVQVLVLEAYDVLDDSPKAAYYGPPAAYEYDRAGVLNEIRQQGFDLIFTCWRKLGSRKTKLLLSLSRSPYDHSWL